MKFGQKIAATGAALAVALGLGVAVSAPASAYAEECPLGYMCVWEHKDYQGRWVGTKVNIPNLGSSSNMNDKTTSFWNRTNHHVALYRHHNYEERPPLAPYYYPSSAWCVHVPPGASSTNVGGFYNDEITSIRVGASCNWPAKTF